MAYFMLYAFNVFYNKPMVEGVGVGGVKENTVLCNVIGFHESCHRGCITDAAGQFCLWLA